MAEVTAYTASSDETDDTPTITACNTTTKVFIAACPERFACGVRILVDGDEYVCEDRMSRKYRYGNFFDLFRETKQEARNFGRQLLEVKIYE